MRTYPLKVQNTDLYVFVCSVKIPLEDPFDSQQGLRPHYVFSTFWQHLEGPPHTFQTPFRSLVKVFKKAFNKDLF